MKHNLGNNITLNVREMKNLLKKRISFIKTKMSKLFLINMTNTKMKYMSILIQMNKTIKMNNIFTMMMYNKLMCNQKNWKILILRNKCKQKIMNYLNKHNWKIMKDKNYRMMMRKYNNKLNKILNRNKKQWQNKNRNNNKNKNREWNKKKIRKQNKNKNNNNNRKLIEMIKLMIPQMLKLKMMIKFQNNNKQINMLNKYLMNIHHGIDLIKTLMILYRKTIMELMKLI